MEILIFLKKYFSQTNFRYNREISPSVCYCTYKADPYGRIEYRLPNNQRKYFYGIREFTSDKKLRDKLLFEFERLLRNGYFPTSQIENLETKKSEEKRESGELSLNECVEIYYTKLNYDVNEKKEKVIKNEKPTLIYLLKYFSEELHIDNIYAITNQHLKSFNSNIHKWCNAKKNRQIKKTTVKSYKKIIKAFLNSIGTELDLEYNTKKIDGNIYYSGKIDREAYARSSYIPEELLDHVDLLEKEPVGNSVDYIELIHLLRTTGLCKDELATLSEENLYPSRQNFDSVSIFNKPDCPTKDGVGLTLKSKNRERVIPLDKRAINFLKTQIERNKDNLIYGKIGETIKYLPYLFLFPVFRNNQWERCDNFLRGIRAIFQKAITQFNLNYDANDYNVHDFRRTFNNKLGDSGMSSEDRAYLLGHDKKVNETNYSNYQKIKELKRKKATKAIRSLIIGKE